MGLKAEPISCCLPFQLSLLSLLVFLPLPLGCNLSFLLGFRLSCLHFGTGFYGQQFGAFLLHTLARLRKAGPCLLIHFPNVYCFIVSFSEFLMADVHVCLLRVTQERLTANSTVSCRLTLCD